MTTVARPRRRPDVAVIEQVYRGDRAFIVKDAATGRYFRFRLVEATVFLALDGTRTPGEAAAALGLMERTLAERSTLELGRLRAERRHRWTWFRGELMRMRFSVGDPDALFDRAIPRLRWCFSRGFVAASAGMFALYFVVFCVDFGEFTRAVAAFYAPAALTIGTVVLVRASTLGARCTRSG